MENDNHNHNGNEHQHSKPLQTIVITIDPNHDTVNYRFENCDYMQVIAYLALVQNLAMQDMRQPNKVSDAN